MAEVNTNEEIRTRALNSLEQHPSINISQKEIEGLLEYSSSIPTGQHEGKRWKRNIVFRNQEIDPVWVIVEYGKTFVENGNELRLIKYFNPVINQ